MCHQQRGSKDTGFGRFPSRVFAINQAWLHLALTGIDLIAWTQTLLLHGDLARAEPKKLRYRLLYAHLMARQLGPDLRPDTELPLRLRMKLSVRPTRASRVGRMARPANRPPRTGRRPGVRTRSS